MEEGKLPKNKTSERVKYQDHMQDLNHLSFNLKTKSETQESNTESLAE